MTCGRYGDAIENKCWTWAMMWRKGSSPILGTFGHIGTLVTVSQVQKWGCESIKLLISLTAVLYSLPVSGDLQCDWCLESKILMEKMITIS